LPLIKALPDSYPCYSDVVLTMNNFEELAAIRDLFRRKSEYKTASENVVMIATISVLGENQALITAKKHRQGGLDAYVAPGRRFERDRLSGSHGYDLVLLNTSGGKDSSVMAWNADEAGEAQGVEGPRSVAWPCHVPGEWNGDDRR